MAQVQQYLLIGSLLAAEFCAVAQGRRFYPDDPIEKVPPPIPVTAINSRKIDPLYDFAYGTWKVPSKKQDSANPVRAGAVNTLDDALDSAWYTRRHYLRRMAIDDLKRGPAGDHDPVPPFRVLGAKTEGVTPGFTVQDSRGQKFLFKTDPLTNPEMASAADVIGSKFFYALGYNVPENYITYFQESDLTIDDKATISIAGRKHQMDRRDLENILERIPQGDDGRYRALASFFIAGKLLGPFRYEGTRSDDPNDLVPHENRRDLRGLYVFCAWLNHTDAKSINSLDSLVTEDGISSIKHYLIDFGASLGSDSDMAKNPRLGHEYMIPKSPVILADMFDLGLRIPRWQRVDYPDIPAAGHFSAEAFDPDRWTSNYPNPAFVRSLPDDEFWAAKQVMAFTDDEIRAMVETGQFSDPEATDWITRTLIARRDKIGRAFFSKVIPIERFRVENGKLVWDDLAARAGWPDLTGSLSVSWSRFDNATGQADPKVGEGATLPQAIAEASNETYWVATIASGDRTVKAYLRNRGSRLETVGIERTWAE